MFIYVDELLLSFSCNFFGGIDIVRGALGNNGASPLFFSKSAILSESVIWIGSFTFASVFLDSNNEALLNTEPGLDWVEFLGELPTLGVNRALFVFNIAFFDVFPGVLGLFMSVCFEKSSIFLLRFSSRTVVIISWLCERCFGDEFGESTSFPWEQAL